MRHRDLRTQRRAKRALWIEVPPDEPEDDDERPEPDGRTPIGPLGVAPIPMREGSPIDPRAPWRMPQ